MITYADLDAFTEQVAERRRQAAEAAPQLLRALGQAAGDPGDGVPPAAEGGAPDNVPPAPVRATAQLIADTLDDLGQAEEELRVQNEALFAAHTELAQEQQAVLDLFELAPVGYVVTTADGLVLRLNRPAIALLGRAANFAAGKPLTMFVEPADRAAFRVAMRRPAASGRVESWRARIVPKGADPLECRVHARAVWPPRADGRADEGQTPLLYWVLTPELHDPLDDLV